MVTGLFNRSSGPEAWPPNLGILRRPEFQRLLDRERNRSDRNNRPFSLLLIDIGGLDAPAIRKICHLVASRIRVTDDIGWFNEDHLGVLLPETDARGASKVASDLEKGFQRLSCPAPIRAYVYHGNLGLAPTEPQEVANQALLEPTQREVLQPGNGQSQALSSNQPILEVENMGELFLKPLPWWKRLEDIVGSLLALIVFSPVFLLIAIGIKLTSKGPVIFKQKRVGRGGKVFTFYKFRTMYVGAEERKKELLPFNEMDGPVFKMKKDPRVTPFGRFLRRTSLDELPQLWNVLKGDMTLVGPRPPTVDEVPKYAAWHRRRLDVTGGITGIWQVSGRNEVPFEEWMRMDARYIRKTSLWTDLKILIKTIWAVISGRGAS